MQKITPFLWFDKNCEEAINFYVDVFKNSKNKTNNSSVISIKRYPEGPLEDPMKGMEGKVLTAVFELEGQKFMALDGGPIFKPNSAVSFYIECDNQEEVDYFWNKLKEGGDPNSQQCGWLMDKYGFSWQVIPKILPELLTQKDKSKADKVLHAMLKMKKIEIDTLKEASNK
jgi:predicted 3-demethylubiquinone-9 3-methyltransferase (glyoxalase superfamily)